MSLSSVFSPAADYGHQTAWRRIRMIGRKNQVVVEMEDLAHGMRCVVEHDGQRVTALRPEFRRIPMNTCTGAGEPLQAVVGTPIGSPFANFYAGGRARQNCTHMFDLARLGVAHATRGETVRDYLMEMPDDNAECRPSTLHRDGDVVLQWRLENSTVLDPEPFAGRHLFRGFTSWAAENFEGDDLEAILVLQKGCFVAQSRRYVLESGPLSAAEQQHNTGLCFGYGHERIAIAVRLEGTRRDFTDHPERLLKFL
ncbi:DUF2889 domain-containing protein [Trinickia violacea]|uniref:DUF2889 domain-containing protein n=1 Tax=Trinickia violacea TaxID=2571746 RepID=A0A4V1EHI1_9BURK|nr:DUF2889 domain-containing protein [Trinickia violacea]QCP50350.1 DUF2889 domain-containing protein [Trinickia violacea]